VAMADMLNALDPASPVRVPCVPVLPSTGPVGPVPSFLGSRRPLAGLLAGGRPGVRCAARAGAGTLPPDGPAGPASPAAVTRA
jgi:hypothetical protein